MEVGEDLKDDVQDQVSGNEVRHDDTDSGDDHTTHPTPNPRQTSPDGAARGREDVPPGLNLEYVNTSRGIRGGRVEEAFDSEVHKSNSDTAAATIGRGASTDITTIATAESPVKIVTSTEVSVNSLSLSKSGNGGRLNTAELGRSGNCADWDENTIANLRDVEGENIVHQMVVVDDFKAAGTITEDSHKDSDKEMSSGNEGSPKSAKSGRIGDDPDLDESRTTSFRDEEGDHSYHQVVDVDEYRAAVTSTEDSCRDPDKEMPTDYDSNHMETHDWEEWDRLQRDCVRKRDKGTKKKANKKRGNR